MHACAPGCTRQLAATRVLQLVCAWLHMHVCLWLPQRMHACCCCIDCVQTPAAAGQLESHTRQGQPARHACQLFAWLLLTLPGDCSACCQDPQVRAAVRSYKQMRAPPVACNCPLLLSRMVSMRVAALDALFRCGALLAMILCHAQCNGSGCNRLVKSILHGTSVLCCCAARLRALCPAHSHV
jgi:hypothetical protein